MRCRFLSRLVAVLAMALALVAGVEHSLAQSRANTLRIGAAGDQSNPAYSLAYGSFLKGMAALGYEEGGNFTFEQVNVTDFTEEALTRAYGELAARKVDVFVVLGREITLKSAIAVAGTTPIVMVAVNWDPLARGYISSLARPGGNVTGMTFQEVELTAKRFQLLMEMVPDLKSATVFWDRTSADQWQEAQAAAAKLGLHIHGVEFAEQPPYDLERGFALVPDEFRTSLITLGSPEFVLPTRKHLPEFALRHRLPSMFVNREFVHQGGLASYGPNYPKMFARAAYYVDRLAKGQKPSDLAVELPTNFELVVNLKTASALGITIPPSVLLGADHLID